MGHRRRTLAWSLAICLSASSCASDRAEQAPSAGAAVDTSGPPAEGDFAGAGWKSQDPPAPFGPRQRPHSPAEQVDLGHLTRADCLRLALWSNRPFLIKHSMWDRARLAETVALSQVYAPQLTANYTVSNHLDSATASVASPTLAPITNTVGVSEPLLGFMLQPFVTSTWNQSGDAATGLDSYTSSYGITVSRMLFNVYERIRQRLPLTSAETNYYIAANNVILQGKSVELDTATAYYNVLRALEHVRIRQRRVEDAVEFLALVEDNVKHGFKAPFETLTAKLDLNQAQTDLVGEQATLKDAVEHLARELGVAVPSALAIAPEDISAGRPMPDLADDLRRAQRFHENLGNQVASLALTLDNLRVSRDQLAPQISAGVTAQAFRVGHQPFAGDLQSGASYALVFSWSDPLDFKSAARAQMHQLEDQIYEQTLTLREAQDDLEQQMRSTWRKIDQLRNTVALSAERMDAEKGNLDATMSRWKSGAIDNLEVTRSKQDLDSAEVQLVDSRCDLAIAYESYRAILPAPTTADGRPWSATGPLGPPVEVRPAAPAHAP